MLARYPRLHVYAVLLHRMSNLGAVAYNLFKLIAWRCYMSRIPPRRIGKFAVAPSVVGTVLHNDMHSGQGRLQGTTRSCRRGLCLCSAQARGFFPIIDCDVLYKLSMMQCLTYSPSVTRAAQPFRPYRNSNGQCCELCTHIRTLAIAKSNPY